jgi:hypothetical protein
VGLYWLDYIIQLHNGPNKVVYNISVKVKSASNCVAALVDNNQPSILFAVSGWNTLPGLKQQLANHGWTLHVRQMCEDMSYRLRICPGIDCSDHYYHASNAEMQLMEYLYYKKTQIQSFVGRELKVIIEKHPCAECEHFIMHWQRRTGITLRFWVNGELHTLKEDLPCTEETCGTKRKGGPLRRCLIVGPQR